MNEVQKSLERTGHGFRSNLDISVLVQSGVLLILFMSIFGPALPALYKDWFDFKQFSHGLLVPFIAGYMVWQKRNELRTTPIKPSLWGVSLIVPALVTALIGKAIGDSFSERMAMIICLSGLVWLLVGWEFLKRLSFPLTYLLLMIPLPYVIVNEVAFTLRIFDAAVAAPVLRLLGVPVYRDNHFLHLPDVTLEVADLCSGISSVFSLFALGGAYVFFSPMRSQFKFLAVLSTIPFAVLINLLRIIITAALSYFVSLSVLNMLIHELTGAITFFIALTLFVVLCEILQRHFPMRVPEPVAKSERGSLADSEKLQRSTLSAPRSWQPALLAMALFIPGVYFSANVKTQAAKSLSNDLSKVGTQLASYQLDDSKGSGFYNDPSADVEISRIYSTAQSAPIELYIGFKSKQQGEKRLKSPRLGFPYGWNYVWIEPARIAADNPSISIDANWMLTQSGQSRVLVLYWFQTGEYTVGGEFGKRMLQIRNALLHSRSDGAVVRLAMAVNSPDHMEEAKRRLSEFAAGLYPRLREVLPL